MRATTRIDWRAMDETRVHDASDLAVTSTRSGLPDSDMGETITSGLRPADLNSRDAGFSETLIDKRSAHNSEL